MAQTGVPHFQNNVGVQVIHIGAREFMCVGASPPFDHPHVFLDMGDNEERICPYCSTLYRYEPSLHGDDSIPDGCSYIPAAA